MPCKSITCPIRLEFRRMASNKLPSTLSPYSRVSPHGKGMDVQLQCFTPLPKCKKLRNEMTEFIPHFFVTNEVEPYWSSVSLIQNQGIYLYRRANLKLLFQVYALLQSNFDLLFLKWPRSAVNDLHTPKYWPRSLILVHSWFELLVDDVMIPSFRWNRAVVRLQGIWLMKFGLISAYVYCRWQSLRCMPGIISKGRLISERPFIICVR